MAKQRKQEQQKDQIKKTIEHDKVIRVKEQLLKLQEYPKRRQKSKNQDKFNFTSQGQHGASTPIQKLTIKGSLPTRSEPLQTNNIELP
jgi:hypothetical protein